MPQDRKAWFGPRAFGYGYTPVSWEGWAVTAVLIVVVLGAGVVLRQAPLAAMAVIFAAVGAFLWIAQRQASSPSKRRWNGRKLP